MDNFWDDTWELYTFVAKEVGFNELNEDIIRNLPFKKLRPLVEDAALRKGVVLPDDDDDDDDN